MPMEMKSVGDDMENDLVRTLTKNLGSSETAQIDLSQVSWASRNKRFGFFGCVLIV